MNHPEMACGINIYCTGPDDPTLEAAFDDLAALGYTHVAFGPIDAAAVPATELAGKLAKAGLSAIAMGAQTPEANVSSEDPAVRAAGLDLLKRFIDYAHALGADQMNGVNYALHKDAAHAFSPQLFTESARLLGQAADYAKQAGITLNFEVVNRYETSMLNTAEQAREYIAASGSDNLRAHLDTFHMGIEEADMCAAVASTVEHIGYLELGQSGRGSILTGAVDNAAVVRAARDAGYRGRYGLEGFTRSILGDVGDMLNIWRTTFTDSHRIAQEAIDLVNSIHDETN